MKEQLSLLFDKYCSPTLSWIRKSTKIQAQGKPYADIGDLQCRVTLLRRDCIQGDETCQKDGEWEKLW